MQADVGRGTQPRGPLRQIFLLVWSGQGNQGFRRENAPVGPVPKFLARVFVRKLKWLVCLFGGTRCHPAHFPTESEAERDPLPEVLPLWQRHCSKAGPEQKFGIAS